PACVSLCPSPSGPLGALSPIAVAGPPAVYPPSLHDALPISLGPEGRADRHRRRDRRADPHGRDRPRRRAGVRGLARPERPLLPRSEEHTSELQSRENLVCRLLLEKKNEERLSEWACF